MDRNTDVTVEVRNVLVEAGEHFDLPEAPNAFRALMSRPRLLVGLWTYWKEFFEDRELPRLTKSMIAQGVAATRNSHYGMALFGHQMRHHGISSEQLLALLLIIGWYNGITKFADLLQTETEFSDEDIQAIKSV